MDEEPGKDGEGSPKIFKSINGWIAGATGVVIALGGLTAAWHDIFPKQQTEAAQPAETTEATDPNASGDSNAATEENAADDPWGYTIDTGGTLRYEGGYWIETDADGTKSRYDPQSVQNGFTYARDEGAGPDGADIDLRWPTAGGQAQKSTDKLATWNDAYVVTAETNNTGN